MKRVFNSQLLRRLSATQRNGLCPAAFPKSCRFKSEAAVFDRSSSVIGTTQSDEGVNRFCQRTHNCGELRLEDVGQQVDVFGWLVFCRMGKFLVIRDSYGIVQATIPDLRQAELQATVEALHRESVVRVRGVVQDRGRNRTKRMKTGDIEIEVAELEVLNATSATLPVFADDTLTNMSQEKTRLTHRYLDLRSERMQHNLRLRSNVTHAMRRFLVERCWFVDVETPTLSQWTPGGAAEFVVPAPRALAGHFYTLPQSPQLYKQLLMCGSIDRYFQVARCYRNEGAKMDRQPEFTQVDLEMSFVTQEDIIALVESLIVESWPEELVDCCPTLPFPRLSYDEAIKCYGSDKPDLRPSKSSGGFAFLWVVDFPLFTPAEAAENGSESKLESTHHPFTAPSSEYLEDLRAGRNLTAIRAQHYDLVMNGVELGGGSIRIHNAALQRHVIENILRLPTDTLERFFDALQYGTPPHGGFALGLDRYVALLAEESHRRRAAAARTSGRKKAVVDEPDIITSIRDVIAFPKTKAGRCLTMGGPSKLPADVYGEYGITIVKTLACEKKAGDELIKPPI